MKAQSGKQLIRKCQDANKSTEHIAIEAIDADEPLREKKQKKILTGLLEMRRPKTPSLTEKA